MQIKVEHTKQHHVSIPQHNDFDREYNALIAGGKLVLVECKPEEALVYIPNWKHEECNLRLLTKDVSLADAVYKAYKPIVISETEKIEENDCVYDKKNGLITPPINKERAVWFNLDINKGLYCKILALPENFSPSQLQMIVDGKLKDGDKVLVECEDKVPYEEGVIDSLQPKGYHIIKLNSSNHITLHKVEEKMYTKQEVEDLTRSAYGRGYGDKFEGKGMRYLEWAEQNVK